MFSLVCCLLRLASLLRESILFSINHNGTARTVTHDTDHTHSVTHTRHRSQHTHTHRGQDTVTEREGKRGDAAHFFGSPSRVWSCVCAVCVPIDKPHSAHIGSGETVRRGGGLRPSAVMHACARAEARYCLSRNRIGPVKLEEGSTTCPLCKISSTPSQANCTAMRRVSGISGRHAVVRDRGASEGQQVFVMPRLRTSSRILASSAPSASGLHSSLWRFGIVASRRCGSANSALLGGGEMNAVNTSGPSAQVWQPLSQTHSGFRSYERHAHTVVVNRQTRGN